MSMYYDGCLLYSRVIRSDIVFSDGTCSVALGEQDLLAMPTVSRDDGVEFGGCSGQPMTLRTAGPGRVILESAAAGELVEHVFVPPEHYTSAERDLVLYCQAGGVFGSPVWMGSGP